MGGAKAAAYAIYAPLRLEPKIKVRHSVDQSADCNVMILETILKV